MIRTGRGQRAEVKPSDVGCAVGQAGELAEHRGGTPCCRQRGHLGGGAPELSLKANASWPREDREKDTADGGNGKAWGEAGHVQNCKETCVITAGALGWRGEEGTGRHGLALREPSKHSLPQPTTPILLSSHTSHGWHF